MKEKSQYIYFFIEISRDSLEKEAWSLKNVDRIVALFFLCKFNYLWLNPYNLNLRFTVGSTLVYFEKTNQLKPYAKIKQTWKGHWQWDSYTTINNYQLLSSGLLASFENQYT